VPNNNNSGKTGDSASDRFHLLFGEWLLEIKVCGTHADEPCQYLLIQGVSGGICHTLEKVPWVKLH